MWQLGINVSKCHVLTVTSSRVPVSNHVYFINNTAISVCDNVLDLGITISTDMSFKNHIESIVSKSYQRLSVLFRGFVTRDMKFLCKAYITFVRPLLEYNSIIWSPTEIYLIDLLEQVQRYFTRKIPAVRDLCYSDRLSALNLPLLELRRLHADLIYYYKIFNNLTPHNPSDFFLVYHPPTATRSASSYLHKPIKGNRKFHSFLCFRSVDAWNALTEETRRATSILSFKRNLRRVDLNSFLIGSVTK